ncbi:hypothetical protein E2562_023992 [Oryza meyeriana var. granulata]|uniref:Uncharacterized protein n=1 Tax=Oryza meyeriana var. granulata TaxID=110450 RepID=A0A6G1EB81_9ORYZ|nr:hypothetical protein E2562_023992 [Oryza meyeriana var. granulata]
MNTSTKKHKIYWKASITSALAFEPVGKTAAAYGAETAAAEQGRQGKTVRPTGRPAFGIGAGTGKLAASVWEPRVGSGEGARREPASGGLEEPRSRARRTVGGRRRDRDREWEGRSHDAATAKHGRAARRV